MSVVDNLKIGLKQSLSNPKKLGIYTVLNAVVLFLLLGALYFMFQPILKNNIVNLTNPVPATMVTDASFYSLIPQTNFYYAIILIILAIIIMLYSGGYMYKLIECAIKQNEEFPGFNNIKSLFGSGLKIAIVGIVYSIIPSILIYIAPTITQLTHMSILGSIISLIGLIIGIFAFLMCIMATNNMIANNSFKDAFDFATVFSLIKSIGWLRFFGAIIFLALILAVIVIGVAIVSGVIIGVLAIGGSIGIQIGVIIMFILLLLAASYLNFVTCLFYGALYNEANLSD